MSRPDFWPVVVFMRIEGARIATLGDEFDPPPGGHTTHVGAVGFLTEIQVDADFSAPSIDTAHSRLQALGLDGNLFIQPHTRQDGLAGCGISYGVLVKTMDEARALPSFRSLYDWSGYHAPYSVPAHDSHVRP